MQTTIFKISKKLVKYLDNITQNIDPLFISLEKNSGVVIISFDEYNSLLSTQYELSSRTSLIQIQPLAYPGTRKRNVEIAVITIRTTIC